MFSVLIGLVPLQRLLANLIEKSNGSIVLIVEAEILALLKYMFIVKVYFL